MKAITDRRLVPVFGIGVEIRRRYFSFIDVSKLSAIIVRLFGYRWHSGIDVSVLCILCRLYVMCVSAAAGV